MVFGLALTGHGEDKTHSYGAVTFGKTPTGEAYKFFVKPELSLMESSGKSRSNCKAIYYGSQW